MRRVMWFFAGLSLLSTIGCSICASPHDCKYAAYGGLRERTDHVNGRVGSVIDPASEINRAAWAGQSGHVAPARPLDAGMPSPETPNAGSPDAGEPEIVAPGQGSPEMQAPESALPETPPSIMPEEVQPPRSPGAVAPPVDLPEGPQPSDGQTLPELPGEDTIELPEAGQTTRRGSTSTRLPMHFVVPASVDLSPEAATLPLGQASALSASGGNSPVARAHQLNDVATPAYTADGRRLRSIMKKPVR